MTPALRLLALAALCLLAGCLPCPHLGASTCIQNTAMACSGTPGQWEEALDCDTVGPGRWVCRQPAPDALAACARADGGTP